MRLVHTFSVPVGIDDVWRALLDFESVAPCLPGAKLDRVNGNEIEGAVKVKLGPVMVNYRGVATVTDCDADTRQMSITGSGRDPKGNSSASAKVTASLTGGEDGEPTNVTVTTDLEVTGRPAQFGRGMMQEVGNRVIGQFAERLAEQLDGNRAAPQAATTNATRKGHGAPVGSSAPSSTTPPGKLRPTQDLEPEQWSANRQQTRTAEPDDDNNALDLGSVAGPALAKRFAPAVGAAVAIAVAVAGIRRRRRRAAAARV